jgi:hypothetical protein
MLFLKLTAWVAPSVSLFQPVFLGDKWPTADFYVELMTSRRPRPYFFIQAKATTAGYLQNPRRLRVRLTRRDEARLVRIPAPTYLVGIDETNNRAYIRSVHTRANSAVSSLRASYPLTIRNLHRLYQEVLEFWRHNASKPTRSVFDV